MKTLLIALLLSGSAIAAPVLNQNMAAEGTKIMIWPDHQDTNHFYYAPSSIHLSSDERGVKFNFVKYKTGCTVLGIGCRKKAMINSLLIADYSQEDLLKAQQGILRSHPHAQFSTIPMFDGKVEFSRTLRSFIVDHDCSPLTGQPSDEIPCSFTLNNKGLKTLVPMLVEGSQIAFQFKYRIEGVAQLPDGVYKTSITNYGIAVKFGGEELRGNEDLE